MRREASDRRLGEYWVQYEPANLVDWGAFRVPVTFTAGFPAEPLGVLIEIVLEDEGPVCVSISRLEQAPSLTSERRFPIRAMVNAAVRAAAFELVEVPVEDVDPRREDPRLVADERGYVQVYAPAFDDRGAGPRSTVPDESEAVSELERVASLYRRAVVAGLPPSAVIAEEFGITRETARKWVQRARAQNLLGPALGRRVGEAARGQLAQSD
jgi:Helix-turn-helix domain